MDSDMDLLLDMMPNENIVYENVEPGQTNEYYQGHAEHILKQLDSVDHYFHFVNHTLSEEQQTIIQDRLGIKPEMVEKIVIKEKIVYKEKKKARVNAFDDY